MPALALLIPLIQALPKAVAAAPEFISLFNQIRAAYGEDEQEALKDAYARARGISDSAQVDFILASHGG